MPYTPELLASLGTELEGPLAKYGQEITQLCSYIFQHPELGFQERQSSEAVIRLLESHGFSVERGCAGMPTAFRAVRASGRPGPTIGLMCEYDALPGIGHACGHNIIAAGSAGVAIITADFLDQLGGTLVVLGTPCEEGGGGGKARLLKAGFMDDLQCAMMIHPGYKTMTRDIFTAISRYKIVFHGKTAHAAGDPQNGINALEAVLLLFCGVDGLRLHLDKDVSLHGIITNGGTAVNMIPDLCEALFAIRALKRESLASVITRLRNCAEGAALATGCTYEFMEDGEGYDDFLINNTLSNLMDQCFLSCGEVLEYKDDTDGKGSTDAGNVSWQVPTFHGMLSFGRPDLLLHTPGFKEYCGNSSGEKMALRAAKSLGMAVLCMLREPDILEAAWAEHRASTAK